MSLAAAVDGGSAGRLHFGVLGPLQVMQGEHVLDVGPWKRRVVLAALLAHANTVVSTDSLIDALWEDAPPLTARKNVQVYVSSLRGQLQQATPDRLIAHQGDGYVFRAGPGVLDSLTAEQHVAAARALRPDGAAAMAAALSGAVSLWRGPVLADMRGIPFIDAAARRLELRLLTLVEDWAEAEVAAGGALEAIERITAAAREHPFRERLQVVRMAALCQLGRRAEALAVYDETRLLLAREFGLSPGAALNTAHQALLREEEDSATAARPQGGQVSLAAGAHLPPEPPTFTGRADCAQSLTRALISGERLAVVTGPVGVGKTAFALHCAHLLRDRFPAGQVFLRLRGTDGTPQAPQEVLSRVLRSPVMPEWPVSAGHALTRWQGWLAEERALVVVDGARCEADVRPYLPETGASVVLVTARPWLSGLGHAYRLPLPPLSPDEAVQMLGRIIGADRVARDPQAAAAIVAAAGCLPLGVRVVGDKLAGLRHLPLHEYVRRLGGGPGLLSELQAGDQAVAARLAEALDDLPAACGQAALRLGSLRSSLFTLSEAALVWGVSDDAAMRTLETLVESNIVTAPTAETVAHTVIYELPPLLLAHVRERAGSLATR